MANVLLDPSNKKSSVSAMEFCKDIMDNLDSYSMSKVVKITHYKTLAFVQHEFLVAEVLHNDRLFYLRMERGVDHSRPLLEKSSSVAAAVDTVEVLDRQPSSLDTSKRSKWPWRYLSPRKSGLLSIRVLKATSSTSSHFSLAELGFVLYFVTRAAPRYHVKKYQCYWFCWIILEMLQNELGDDVSIQHAQDFAKGGTYRDLVILDKSDSILKDFIKDTREKLDEIDAQGAQIAIQNYFKNVLPQLPAVNPRQKATESIFRNYALEQIASKKKVVKAISRIAEEQRIEEAMTPTARALYRAVGHSSRPNLIPDEHRYDSWTYLAEGSGVTPLKKLTAPYDEW
ncbi:hypothetical protein BDQ17DRAFT_1410869 [Cyathus striatus]|nr:hypothetical protein BDQ17DRAFT_1410869 [Cyathus striatus]